MKNTLTVVTFLMACSFVLAQTDAANKSGKSFEATKEFQQLYKSWDQALVKVDLPFLDRIYADEAIFTGTDGSSVSKSQAVDELKSGQDVVSAADTDEFQLTVIGNTAIVSCRWTAKETYKGKDVSGQSRYTDTWVKRDGRWQLLASHGSKIDNTEQDLLALERQVCAAYVKRDLNFLDRTFASDYTFIQGEGNIHSRAQELERLRKGDLTFDKVDLHEAQVKSYGDFAIVIARVTFAGKSPEGSFSGNERLTDAFTRRDGRWQLVATQATPIKP